MNTVEILTLFSAASSKKIKPCEALAMLTCSISKNGISIHIRDIMSSTGMSRSDALDTVNRLLDRGYLHHQEYSYSLTSLGQSIMKELTHQPK